MCISLNETSCHTNLRMVSHVSLESQYWDLFVHKVLQTVHTVDTVHVLDHSEGKKHNHWPL